MKNILLINQGNTENLGDKTINIVFQRLIEEYGYNVDFVGFAKTDEQFMDEMNYESKSSLKSYIKLLVPSVIVWLFKYRKLINSEFDIIKDRRYDLVIIGGGQLIKTKNVFVYTLFTWINILNKNMSCPIALVGVGSDEKYSIIEKLLYKKTLKKVNEIYVRDGESRITLKKEFNVNSKSIPDIVFAYSRFFPTKINFSKKNKLLVMIYDYKALKKNFETEFNTIDKYFLYWKSLIEKNLEENLKIVLAYTTIGDKKTTYKFKKYLEKNTEIQCEIRNTDRLDDLANVLITTKTLISGRMHGMLLGLNYHCEIVPYVLSPKIKVFKKEYLDKELNIKQINKEIDKSIEELMSYINN